jgi:hypothetical protein
MSYWSILSRHANITVNVYGNESVYDKTTGETTQSRSLLRQIQAIKWDTTTSNSNIAQKIRDRADAVLGMSPDAIISKENEAEIDNTKYSILHVDNVTNSGKINIVYLEDQS